MNSITMTSKVQAEDSFSVHHPEEIDVTQLVADLWSGRNVILVTLFLCLGIGFMVAFLTEERWTTDVEVVIPSVTDTGVITELNAFPGVHNQEGIPLIESKSSQFTADYLLEEYLRQAASYDAKLEFWISVEGMSSNSMAERRALDKAAHSIRTIAADGRKRLVNTISVSASSALSAKSLMEDYLLFVNDRVLESLRSGLELHIASMIAERTSLLKAFASLREAVHAQEIVRLKRDIAMARAAGISEFSESNRVSEQSRFLLGQKVLQAELLSLSKASPIKSDQERLLEAQIKKLQGYIARSEWEIVPVRFLKSPQEPLARDKPKRTLLVILSAVLGMMLGVILVILHKGIKAVQSKLNASA